MKRILHLTPHMGGGPGNVIKSFISFEINNNSNNIYSIATLDYANDNAKKFCLENKIELFENIHKNTTNFLNSINNYDIILVHFWNHPFLYNLIVRNVIPNNRMVFWAHTSGFVPPSVFSNKLLSYPDLFLFSSPISFETTEVKNYKFKNRLKYISSTCDTSKFTNISFDSHLNFNVLYIGTVDFSKMYSNFVKLCSQIDIPNIKFIVCGGPNHLELEKEANELGIGYKFEFLGKVNNIIDYIKIADVFGYPLTKNHYGTTDQVLVEAMSSGLVPVVFDNLMEKYMVKNDHYGFICSTEKEYINAIKLLYINKDLKNKMSVDVKKYALEKFSLEKMVNKFNIIFDNLMLSKKTTKKWDIDKNNINTLDIFKESIGDYSNIFSLKYDELQKELSKSNWNSNSTGTLNQYKALLDDGSLDNFIIL